jgi:hypothetical protein
LSLGSRGQSLPALLAPPDREAVATALFADCFACGKDNLAAWRIAETLAQRGRRGTRCKHVASARIDDRRPSIGAAAEGGAKCPRAARSPDKNFLVIIKGGVICKMPWRPELAGLTYSQACGACCSGVDARIAI